MVDIAAAALLSLAHNSPAPEVDAGCFDPLCQSVWLLVGVRSRFRHRFGMGLYREFSNLNKRYRRRKVDPQGASDDVHHNLVKEEMDIWRNHQSMAAIVATSQRKRDRNGRSFGSTGAEACRVRHSPP